MATALTRVSPTGRFRLPGALALAIIVVILILPL
jgi:hypothetical protein